MSVMLLDTNTFQDCYKTINEGTYLRNGSGNCLYGFINWGYYDNNEQTQLQQFFQKLYNLNKQSWNNRYNENEPETINGLNLDKGNIVNIHQLLKHLRCISYQIEDDLENTPTFDYLTKMIEQLTGLIIDKIPEYDLAKWS